MALQMTGSDVALVRDAKTGRYDLVFSTSGPNAGNVVLTSDASHAVLSTLLSWRRGTRPGSQSAEGGYVWDTAGTRGTLLWTVTQDRLATVSQLTSYAEDGMQQLVDLKLIASFTVSAQRVAPGKFRIDVAWTLPSGTRAPGLSVTL